MPHLNFKQFNLIQQGWPLLVGIIGLCLLFFWQFNLLLTTSGGLFSYVLDDAYIHLALSENIIKGHYGVNLEEYSAPSSSILWSFLLAPLAHWEYWPLILNGLLSVTALGLWHFHISSQFCQQLTAPLVFSSHIFFIFAANLVGTSFTGMENLLQLVVTMVICLEVFRLIDSNPVFKPAQTHNLSVTQNLFNTLTALQQATPPVSYWLCLCIILAPLVRYETITFSCIGLVFMLARGQFKASFITFGLMLAPLLTFSWFLYSLDLGFLPSSISAKSSALQDSALQATLLNFYNNMYEPTGSLLLILLLPLLWRGFSQWQTKPLVSLYSILIAGAVVAHLAMGRLGNWGRYEIYVWIGLLMSLIYLYAEPVRQWLEKPQFPRIIAIGFLGLFTIICAKRYIVTSVSNHIGGANIAVQQRQMHEFVTGYWQAPVAVNDLGWVAYQNDHYVLDVWGLANVQALKLRKQNAPDFLNTLAKLHSIDLAMIYQDWFAPELLANWTLVGELHFPPGLRRMTSAQERVAFYATNSGAVAQIRQKMKKFEPNLAGGAYFTYTY